MDDVNRFHNITSADELKFVKHNPTDFEKFKEFQAALDAKYEHHEKAKLERETKANLRRWEELLPDRWSGAVLGKIRKEQNPEAAEAILKILKNEEAAVSFFIRGASGTGKTYLAYAILRRYIGLNWTTPSHIKIISEEAIMGFAASGFEGQARFNDLLKPQYGVYLFDGLGARATYSPKEQQLWEQLIDHIYNRSLAAIFTSNHSASRFAGCLSDSAESKLQHLLDGKIITANGRGKKTTLDDGDSFTTKPIPQKEDEQYGLWKD